MTPTRRAVLARAAATLVVLAGCAGPTDTPAGQPQSPPAPVVLDEPAPESEAEATLPLPLAPFRMVEPGWHRAPEERDGIFLGAAETGDGLRFVAADGEGTLLWEAHRPASSTVALTRAGDRAVAVLTDRATSDGSAGPHTASAYDLADGERLWGPVEVPGPHRGPGLVFAEGEPDALDRETGPRTVLDAVTGEVVADEAAGTAVVGEYDGVVLTSQAGDLTAARDGAELWRLPSADLGTDLAAVAGARPPEGTALVGPAGGETGALLDLADGTVLARDVTDARTDPATGTVVTLAPGTLSGRPPEGDAWSRPVTDDVRLSSVGGVLVYLRVGDALQVRNAVTGEEADAYGEPGEGGFAVPVAFSAAGAAVVRTGETFGLVTTVPR